MSDKYIVFKLEDWEKHTGWGVVAEPVEDAVVIRRQDVFAPALLTLYSQNVLTVVDMFRAYLPISPEAQVEFDKKMDELVDTATYFMQQAELAWQMDRKLPD